MAQKTYDILQACREPELFGTWFRDKASWRPWQALLGALFGLPLSEDQATVFRQCTGRSVAPASPFSEAWLICGRRAGKSYILALIAVYLACFRDYRPYLAPGERAVIRVMASDRDQAKVIFRYIGALLREIPILAKKIQRETAESFELERRVTIETGSASFRSSRGYSFAAVLCDEIAFWRLDDNSANPDVEVLNAIRPGMTTIPGSILLCASSPYARKGALFDAYRRYHGKNDAPVLVWRASTRTMNPTVSQDVVDQALELDHAAAAAEYLAEFRSDIESFIGLEAVRACVDPDCFERPPERRWRYWAFTDPSGGRSDSFTLAIAHKEGQTVVLDRIREIKPPFSPEGVCEEFSDILKRYRLSSVWGDKYAGEWPIEQFRKHGITYRASEHTKSECYQYLLPLINSKAVALLDSDRLVNQLIGLERRTARGGKDSVDHGPGLHDDVANSTAGVLTLASMKASGWTTAPPEPKRQPVRLPDAYEGTGYGWMSI